MIHSSNINNKKECSKEIVHILRSHFKRSFIDIYKRIKKTSPKKYVLKDLQDYLRTIPKWKKEDIFDNSKQLAPAIDRYRSLLKRLCKIKGENYSSISDIDVKVLHTCFIEIARELFRKPILVYDGIDTQTYMQNMAKFEKMIHHCIKSTLRTVFMDIDIVISEPEQNRDKASSDDDDHKKGESSSCQEGGSVDESSEDKERKMVHVSDEEEKETNESDADELSSKSVSESDEEDDEEDEEERSTSESDEEDDEEENKSEEDEEERSIRSESDEKETNESDADEEQKSVVDVVEEEQLEMKRNDADIKSVLCHGDRESASDQQKKLLVSKDKNEAETEVIIDRKQLKRKNILTKHIYITLFRKSSLFRKLAARSYFHPLNIH